MDKQTEVSEILYNNYGKVDYKWNIRMHTYNNVRKNKKNINQILYNNNYYEAYRSCEQNFGYVIDYTSCCPL